MIIWVSFTRIAVLCTLACTMTAGAATSKKGLQVQVVDDALTLGIKHAALNVNLTGLVDLSRHADSFQWTKDGETFFFRRSAVERVPVKRLSDAGVSVTLILLTYESSNTNLKAGNVRGLGQRRTIKFGHFDHAARAQRDKHSGAGGNLG